MSINFEEGQRIPRILGIFTCYNRKQKTISCLESLVKGNHELMFKFLAVDDASTDGTTEALERLKDVEVIEGDGKLYYSGGMRKGISVAKSQYKDFDYCLLFNDDVEFYPKTICRMKELLKKENQIIIGATCDSTGRLSYGGVKKCSVVKPKFQIVMSDEKIRDCDTFNANCVLISYATFLKLPNIDNRYTHSMGDFDYGLVAKKLGCILNPTNFFVGVCNDNLIVNTWRDTSLSRRERWKLKESPKGLPVKEWFYFVKKHFNFFSACYSSLSPYLKIILRK